MIVFVASQTQAIMLFHSPDDETIQAFFGDQEIPASITVEVGDREFHYMDTQKEASTVIVFVHGSPGGWDAFMPYFRKPELTNRFRLISVDRPGFGKSSFGRAEPSLEKQAEMISEVFKTIKPEQQLILVGHSLGGPVIAQMAIDYPERIDGLLFIAASMDPELEKKAWYQSPGDWWIFRWMVPDAWRVCNEEILPLKKELIKQQPHLKDIRLPVLVVQGEDDELVPAANADYIQAEFVHADLEVKRYAKLNHFIPFTRHDLVIEAILELAEKVENKALENEIPPQE